MTLSTLIRRGLRFHARSHLGALLGSAVGAAVLIGALLVGDSVRGSLRAMALARLGKIDSALASNDRFFRAALARELTQAAGVPVGPAVQIAGTAVSADGSARANQVQVLGVDAEFWKLRESGGPVQPPGPDEVAINEPLAEQLQARAGDTILLRVDKPAQLSREAPLSPQEDFAIALRVTVRSVVPEAQLGRFSLHANQIAPFNAFFDLDWLGARLQLHGRANLLLSGPAPGAAATLASALRRSWQLADAELHLRPLPGGGLELRTPRVFLDPSAVAAARAAAPSTTGLLTYFVNELRIGEQAAPYSMVTAAEPPLVPADLAENEVLLHPWLAEDLHAKTGDRLRMRYFVIGPSRTLEERETEFSVRAILPPDGPASDRDLMPDFPGLEKAESTKDWDSSLPIKLDRIRPQDEEYWKQYRGAPKAIISLAAGRKIWGNRFGDLTAIRYPAGTDASQAGPALLSALDPASFGLRFEPVRQQAIAAGEQAQDFGQLFLGFSFFLIVAALMLMALLFQFGIEQRTTEVGTLLAIGFTPKQVRRLLLGEGMALASLGALAGIPGGIAYAKAMLYGLSTIWKSAVGTSALQFHAHGLTLIVGAASGIVVGTMTIALAVRHQARAPARELLAQGAEPENARSTRPSRGIWLGWLTSASAMLLIGWAGFSHQSSNPAVFFLAGALLLISGLGFAAACLSALSGLVGAARPRLSSLGLRNAARRRRRSLATVALLACGSFLIASIGVFRLESVEGVRKRASGTGGFALIGEASIPIVHDLNTEEGRQYFGVNDQELAGVRVVPLRVRDGEDASCLNLNRAQKPRLLGVQPESLAERGAFTFVKTTGAAQGANPWLLLHERPSDGAVPAIGDAASIQWALGKRIGDTMAFTDERGGEFVVRLVGAVANSILQGNLLIAEGEFTQRYPAEAGYRMFLVDVQPYTPAQINAVAARLSRATQDYGVQFTTAARRLAAFNAVQNTYLNTFQVLGGLGLLLGSVGLGVVVLRNVLERRSELALLLAVGFRSRALHQLVLLEHGGLLVLGLAIGLLAALVAVLPTVLAPGATLPYRSLFWTLGAILSSGLLWTGMATRLALRGKLLEALRNH